MSSKSICDKCVHRWSHGGKKFCNKDDGPNFKYTINKKECPGFVEGKNDKYYRGKDGSNRKGRCW